MNQEVLLNLLQQNPFALAPMAGISDRAFRTFMRQMGCGVVFTELVSATGLKFSSEKTRRLMEFDPLQHPVGIQLFGEDLDHLAEAAKIVEQMGADLVDLNFGCPVPKVVKKGGGSAVLKDLTQVQKVFRKVRKATAIPLTVKIRTGWDESSRNSKEVTQVAYDEGLTWVTIHGRTRAAGYSGSADWDYITEVKNNARIPIIGNGDLTTSSLAIKRLTSSGCEGVMIGRGCLKNPWIFQEAKNKFLHQNLPIERDFLKVFESLEEHYGKCVSEKIILLQLKKFAAWFSSGYPEASNFRKKIFNLQDLTSLKLFIKEFYTPLKDQVPLDTSGESFLMGGHG